MSENFCIIGKKVIYGNNVSHSNRKTRRRFLPNRKTFSLVSDALGGRMVKLRSISVHGARSIFHNSGIDAFLLSTPNAQLPKKIKAIKKKIIRAQKRNEDIKSEINIAEIDIAQPIL